MNKTEIQEAILVSLDKEENKSSGIINKNESEMLSFTNIKTINCVVDEKNGNAIDLETGNVYHIIQRDTWGILSKEEVDLIINSVSDTLFVYRYYKKNMEDISLLYQMLLKSRAQKKYQEYLEGIKRVESGKVKTITKNRPGSKIGK